MFGLVGLRPGGKVKLLHSSSLQTTERLTQDIIMGFGSPVSLQLKFLPSDSNHYFIGTNMVGVARSCLIFGLMVFLITLTFILVLKCFLKCIFSHYLRVWLDMVRGIA